VFRVLPTRTTGNAKVCLRCQALSWRFFGTKTTVADCAGHKLAQNFALEWVKSFARGIRVHIGKIFQLHPEGGACECDFLCIFPPGNAFQNLVHL